MPVSRDIKFVSNSELTSKGPSRLALVIGNSRYRHIAKLNNPENDAKDIADALIRVGFEVIRANNSDHQHMMRALAAFSQQLKHSQGVGLFYYAGHGVQVSGKNYLLPVNAKIAKPSDIAFEAMDLGRVLAEMATANSRLNIVILDACRDNPFAGSFRQLSRGLAQTRAPSGTLLAYATAPGDVASDGDGRNGLYTQYLLEHLEKPGQTLEALFKQVRLAVMQKTNKKQVPWESSSLLGEFYFVAKTNNKKAFALSADKTADLCTQTPINQRPINCLFGDQ